MVLQTLQLSLTFDRFFQSVLINYLKKYQCLHDSEQVVLWFE